jgi:hypothetical protein
MFTVQKATSEDFERVYPLFEGFAAPLIPKEKWKRIFAPPWKTTEGFCGYLLLKDDEVKGFLGLIFSERLLERKPERFCNMTSWVVREECRGQSILLLLELLKLKNYTLTNFTASPTVATILTKLGFTAFPLDQTVLFPLPSVGRNVDFDTDLRAIRLKLSEDDLKIFDDHQGFGCEHLLLRSNDGDCYVVLTKTKRKHLPFAKVHHLSNPRVFNECMESLITRVCLRLRVFGVIVDERYIAGWRFDRSMKYPHQKSGYFKSNSITNPNRIDTIYSELVLLHQ